jgi:hypothetical protein
MTFLIKIEIFDLFFLIGSESQRRHKQLKLNPYAYSSWTGTAGFLFCFLEIDSDSFYYFIKGQLIWRITLICTRDQTRFFFLPFNGIDIIFNVSFSLSLPKELP